MHILKDVRVSLGSLGMVLLIFVAGASPLPVNAQAPFPSNPIQLKVPFAPGGATDVAARLVAAALSKRLGQPVVIENKPGAAGNIAAQFVAQAKPDGYTLLLAYSGILEINPFMLEKIPFDVNKDFVLIGRIGEYPMVIVTNPLLQAKTVSELIALSKQSATGLDVGVAGLGATDHLLVVQVAQKTGAKFKIIPYKGGGPVLTDLLGGQIQFAMSSTSTVAPFVKSGKVRALAVSSAERWPTLPDVPTIAERGAPGVVMTNLVGLVGPAGVPRAIVDRINSELNAVLATQELKESLLAIGVRAAPGTPEDYRDETRRNYDHFGPLIKSMGIKME